MNGNHWHHFMIFIDIFFIKTICTILAKNPCKKCLVKPCCSELCEVKFEYNKLCDIDGNIKMLKFSAFSILFGVVMLGFSLTKLIIELI